MSIRVLVALYLCGYFLLSAFLWYIAIVWLSFARTDSTDPWFSLWVVSFFTYLFAVICLYYFPLRPARRLWRCFAAFASGILVLLIWLASVFIGAQALAL